MDVPSARIQYGTCKEGGDEKTLEWLRLAAVWAALRDHSYEAQAEVAYRAWRDTDRKVHDVIVREGPVPDWALSENDVNVYIRTKVWPMATLWVRGLTTTLRRDDGHAGLNDPTWHGPHYGAPPGSGQSAEETLPVPDGRWIVESAGPGVQGLPTDVNGRTHFINLKLYKAVGL
jgi:hypothetical protein